LAVPLLNVRSEINLWPGFASRPINKSGLYLVQLGKCFQEQKWVSEVPSHDYVPFDVNADLFSQSFLDQGQEIATAQLKAHHCHSLRPMDFHLWQLDGSNL
jgi:hypothetical protein